MFVLLFVVMCLLLRLLRSISSVCVFRCLLRVLLLLRGVLIILVFALRGMLRVIIMCRVVLRRVLLMFMCVCVSSSSV